MFLKFRHGKQPSCFDGHVVDEKGGAAGEEEARTPTGMVKLNGQQLRDSLRPQNVTATLKSGAPRRHIRRRRGVLVKRLDIVKRYRQCAAG